MRIDVVTIFPEMFSGVLGASILKRAQAAGRLEVHLHDLRDYSHDKHRKVDDRPYGGGPGMVMRVEPIAEAVEAVRRSCAEHGQAQPGAPSTPRLGPRPWPGNPRSGCRPARVEGSSRAKSRDDAVEPRACPGGSTRPSIPRLVALTRDRGERAERVESTTSLGTRSGCRPSSSSTGLHCQTILMSPQGEPLSSAAAQELAPATHLIVICGHYEGVDERVKLSVADRCVSIGDYVLTGGELPAMVLIDAVARFIPGVLGHDQATEEESFADGRLEHPQYTRPPVFRGLAVPEVLVSGDHERIAAWRRQQSAARTATCRPDLVNGGG